VRQKSKGFDFKQFRIEHDRCAMKVGTDAVLLGAWVEVEKTTRILDIGTGSGIIALMLAQRTPSNARIDALEPEQEAAEQAQENVDRSPWNNKIIVHQKKLQEFKAPYKYDLIVSNPPYFLNSQLPPSPHRSKARHTHSLSHSELIQGVLQLLNENGRLAVILPTIEGINFQELAKTAKLFVNRQLAFFSRDGKPQERWLFELSFQPKEIANETLILHAHGEAWSDAYQQLTSAFYTKL